MSATDTVVEQKGSRSDLATVSQGAATLMIGMGMATASGLVITIALTRNLGTARYGTLALAIGITSILQSLSGLGISNGTVRMLSFAQAEGDEPQALRLLRAALLLGLVTGGGAGLVVLLLTTVGGLGGSETATILLILAPLMVANGLRSMLYAALRASRQLRALFVLQVGIPVLDVLIVLALVALGVRHIAWYAAALVMVGYVETALALAFVSRRRPLRPFTQTTRRDVKRLIAFSLPLAVTLTSFFAIQSSDVVLLGLLRSTTEAGLYAPVMRVSEAAGKILAAFPLLYVPVATAYAAAGRRRDLAGLYVSVNKWAYTLGFAVILGLLIAPGEALSLLFGSPYSTMDATARILALGYWTSLLAGLHSPTLTAMGAVKELAKLAVVGLLLNLVLELALIPRFGTSGAAWSNMGSYLFLNVAYAVLLYRRAGITAFRRDAVNLYVFSAVVAAGALLALRLPLARSDAGALAVAGAAIGVWLAAALLGRPFGMEWGEVRQVIPFFRPRPGPERLASEAATAPTLLPEPDPELRP